MTEIEVYRQNTPAPRPEVDSWIAVVGDVAKLASHIADTQFVPESLRGNPAAVAAAILSGRESGVGPMAALQNIAVIKGKPAQSALLMRQLALAAGNSIRYVETTDSRCVVEGRRRGEERWERVTFTADQARKARIDLGGYPEDKLVARATARLCRRLFSDAIGGTPYVVEELEDGIEPESMDAGPAPVEPPKRTAQRRTPQKARPAPVSAPQPAVEAEADMPPLPGEDGYEEEVAAAEPVESEQSKDAVTEPEPTEDAPVTPAQLKAVHTVYSRLGVEDRDERLTVAAAVVGHELETSKDLTKREAAQLIDTLARVSESGQDFTSWFAALLATQAAEFEAAMGGAS